MFAAWPKFAWSLDLFDWMLSSPPPAAPPAPPPMTIPHILTYGLFNTELTTTHAAILFFIQAVVIITLFIILRSFLQHYKDLAKQTMRSLLTIGVNFARLGLAHILRTLVAMKASTEIMLVATCTTLMLSTATIFDYTTRAGQSIHQNFRALIGHMIVYTIAALHHILDYTTRAAQSIYQNFRELIRHMTFYISAALHYILRLLQLLWHMALVLHVIIFTSLDNNDDPTFNPENIDSEIDQVCKDRKDVQKRQWQIDNHLSLENLKSNKRIRRLTKEIAQKETSASRFEQDAECSTRKAKGIRKEKASQEDETAMEVQAIDANNKRSRRLLEG